MPVMRRLAVLAALVVAVAGSGAAQAAVLGEQRVLIMLVTWGPQPYPQAQAVAALDEAAAYMRSASFGRTWIVGEVTPWMQALPTRPSGCDLQPITSAALAAAQARGYNTAGYTTLGIAVPQIDCFWTGAYFPPGIWMNGAMSRFLIAHELGHTYGVTEEGPAWVCHARCQSQPYGNPFSVMGSGLSDFGAWEKSQFGWLGPVPRVERPGRYRIAAIDRPSSDAHALRVLVAGDEYWLEYRPPAPIWAFGPPQATPGVVVYGHANELGEASRFPGRNHVLDDPVRRGRPSVQAGETFSVPGAFAVTVASADAAAADVTFRWTDRIRPGRPRLLRPVRRGRRLIVRWRRGAERGSGVAAHEVYLDGRRAGRVAAVRATAGLLVLNDDRMTIPASRGRHRLSVVAVDRAGNRSRQATRVFRS
jgi:hypothetical protein